MKVVRAEFITSAVDGSGYPQGNLPEIAFAGRSNVGKSSLINALVNRKNLARTSNTPGRTRQINFFSIDDRLIFVDLPGYGYARVPKSVRRSWGTMIEGYFRGRPQLVGTVAIVDCRHTPTSGDRQLVEWLGAYKIPFIVVATKADKITQNARRGKLESIRETLDLPPQIPVNFFSARTGEGKNAIWSHISRMINSRKEV
ncbi:MAG: ribosome biogenesis GTP-binding protein YihA/YsxC [bacterium]